MGTKTHQIMACHGIEGLPWILSKLAKLRWMRWGLLLATKGTHTGCGMRSIIIQERSWRMALAAEKMRSS